MGYTNICQVPDNNFLYIIHNCIMGLSLLNVDLSIIIIIMIMRDFITLVYTELILVWLCRKLVAKIETFQNPFLEPTMQYWTMIVKFLAQGNNGLTLTGFELIWLAILRLLVWRVNNWTTPPPRYFNRSDHTDVQAGLAFKCYHGNSLLVLSIHWVVHGI